MAENTLLPEMRGLPLGHRVCGGTALTRGTIQDELMTIVRETHQTMFMITPDPDTIPSQPPQNHFKHRSHSHEPQRHH